MKLSHPISSLAEHYDAVVIGSGYGASVAALRLAESDRSVAVLERGREWSTGDFPDDEASAIEQFHVHGQTELPGKSNGLYDLRTGADMHVVTGCGLGGTSLINASVVIEPTQDVMRSPSWPEAFRSDASGWQAALARATQMLRPAQDPEPRHKLRALEKVGQRLGAALSRPTLAVNFDIDGTNAHGATQKPCTGCGDCVSGCNYGAKNTLSMNYLPAATRAGAKIFCEIDVHRIVRDGKSWRIFYRWLSSGADAFAAPDLSVTADSVFLGAGAIGSTEILLRSANAGLAVSQSLGKRFSANGDVMAFVYNTNETVDAIGSQPASDSPAGPCISGAIDLRDDPDTPMLIEEGVLPGVLGKLYPKLLRAAADATGLNLDTSPRDDIGEAKRKARAVFNATRNTPLSNTMTYLVMAHDDADGQIKLHAGHARVHWPEVGKADVFKAIDKKLIAGSMALSGRYVRNPIWNEALGHQLVTVHPLGGCPMGESAQKGVVNDCGQVFDTTSASPNTNHLHPGLFVVDGAVVPCSVGANPLLTITAVAERALQKIVTQLPAPGVKRDRAAPATPPAHQLAASGPGIRFTERMVGEIYAEQPGTRTSASNAAEFVLTILAPSLQRLLDDPQHRADLIGTVRIDQLSDEPMQVVNGQFELLSEARDAVETRQMTYTLTLKSREGIKYYFFGRKTITDDPGMDVWHDTTTLAVNVTSDQAGRQLVAKGSLKIKLADFARQLTTMDTPGARNDAERLLAMSRFGQFFAGSLFKTYGGIVAGPTYFNRSARPRQKRALRAPLPHTFPVRTRDGRSLRLTRFQGGKRGPVLLVHGLGVSSRIFTVDTIDTNLVEALVSEGFDCWLLDLRVSVDLPALASQPSTGDDVASYDYPAAIGVIREQTGAGSVDVIAHCYGATTMSMSLLSGLPGVRSLVISQVSCDVISGTAGVIKAGLFLPSVLDAIGIDSMTARTYADANAVSRLFDKAVGLFNKTDLDDRCANPICHRVQFMYSVLYEHDQLNDATHDNIHELFGQANMSAFRHLADMVRHKHVVDADGKNIYLPGIGGLNRPVLFIHGEKNQCYLPESTALTLQRLTRAFDQRHFHRKVISGHGHIDSIFGKNAARDVYPHIVAHLTQYDQWTPLNAPQRPTSQADN